MQSRVKNVKDKKSIGKYKAKLFQFIKFYVSNK